MAVFQILSDGIASAIFGGFASSDFKSTYTAGWDGTVLSAKKIASSIGQAANQAKEAFKKGLSFFKQWWKDDPVGASAGALAGVLALGVVVLVGGKVLAAVSGGIAALGSMNLLGTLGTAIGVGGAIGILGGLIRWAVRGIQYMWNFNWNITDKEIRKQQDSLITSLYGQAGAVVGAGLASLLCGAAPVELIKRNNLIKVNPMALAKIKELTEFDPQSDNYGELYEELMESMKALVQSGIRVGAQYAFIESYKNIRKWIKSGSKAAGLEKIMPGLAKLIEKWGAEGSQSWSFASAIENAIEKIPDERIKNFTEEAVENFMDVCTENAMVISYIF